MGKFNACCHAVVKGDVRGMQAGDRVLVGEGKRDRLGSAVTSPGRGGGSAQTCQAG